MLVQINMAIIKMYGIKNCDAVRKAEKWLKYQDIAYSFHNIQSEKINKAIFDSWLIPHKFETIINKKSATWRGLPKETRRKWLESQNTELLLELPTIIKRPILDVDGIIYVGFTANKYKAIFS